MSLRVTLNIIDMQVSNPHIQTMRCDSLKFRMTKLRLLCPLVISFTKVHGPRLLVDYSVGVEAKRAVLRIAPQIHGETFRCYLIVGRSVSIFAASTSGKASRNIYLVWSA